ncbi:MAG: dTDP-4-dehydrorhamnose reductase [Planctomycetes bacterium]|nr:dTDP-4-dehydrorhamnose reductase [Planctomycetota bacterium]
MGSTRIAVVGSSGMLASALRHVSGEAVVAWPSAKVDVREERRVREAIEGDRPAVVINCAAFTDVDGAEARPEEAYAVNQFGAANVAAACEAAGVRLVHVSTDYVFDGKKAGAYVESDSTGPLGIYGDSKLWGEREVASRCENHLIARTAWLYGPWSRRNFVDTMLKLTAERPAVDVVSDVRGSPTYSLDLARALLFLATSSLRGVVHAVNAGSTTWHGLASEIVKSAGRNCEVRPVSQAAFPRPARRPSNSVLDISKLDVAGHRMRPWEEALREYVRDFGGAAAR